MMGGRARQGPGKSGHLATGEQAGNGRLAGQPGLHAAAHVVLRRHHRDGVPRDVHAHFRAPRRNVGEMRQSLCATVHIVA